MPRLLALLIALLLTLPCAAQSSTLEDLPGYDRYQDVRQGSGVTSARVRSPRWSSDGRRLYFGRTSERMMCDLETGEVRPAENEEPEPEAESGRRGPRRGRAGRGRQLKEEPSPDGQWKAICRDWNVVIERTDGPGRMIVTTDGDAKNRFGIADWVYGEELRQNSAMWWSPDSSMLAFYAFDETGVRDYYLTGGNTDIHTKLMREGYPKAGDPNPVAGLRIFDLDEGITIPVDVGAETEQYIYGVRFSPDGSELLFHRTNRRQNVLEIMAADVETGESRVVVTEVQETWQENSPTMRFLEDGQRFIWETERSGWRHYELRHLDGRLLHRLTTGDYADGRILRVDEERGVMFYMAFSDENPLNAQLHRVNLDGTDQRRMTRESLNHQVTLAPDGESFLTIRQSAEQPPVTALCTADGRTVAVLKEADDGEMRDRGIQPAELFSFPAEDGTILYGRLHKPTDFDPRRRYPLVIDVYGGPTVQRVRNTFGGSKSECEFGCIIAVIDNRGTPGRGKAFETAAYMQLGTVDLADQVAGVRHLAQRPYIDATRVGISGHSYGGYMAALAILRHPDVFHVAVAGSAVTSWRNYDTIYTERYMWIPQENAEGYDAGSCMEYADQLEGRLLIMHGLVDDNVHPANAFQLVDALQDANKWYDIELYPNNGHGLGRHGYRRQWRFMADHLIQSTSSEPAPRDRRPVGVGG